MTDYSEPDLVYLLEHLVSLNYKSLPKSRCKAPVTNESWGRAACQKRRLQKLKGQKPYYEASRALYKCSICANVFHTWSAAAQHGKETHFGPVAVYCMLCGYRLPVSRRNQHESFCGWRILDGDPNKPSRIWLCCLQNLLRLTKREVCELIDMCDFLRPDGRCNTRGKHCPGDTVTVIWSFPPVTALALYFFQQLRRLAENSKASKLEPSCKLDEGQELNPCSQIDNEILAGTKGIRDVFNWVMQDKPITSRKLLIWDPGMFSTPNDELYHEFYPPLSNAQEYKWIRLVERQFTLFTLTYDPCRRLEQRQTRKSIAGSTDVALREGAGRAWRDARIPRQRYPGRYDWCRPLS